MSHLAQAPVFRHEALFYAGEDEFLASAVPFITEGMDRDEPVLVVVGAPRVEALRRALSGWADRVQFADMAEVGRNPARIIPAWRDFVNDNGGGTRRLRGIGEPMSADRSEAALAECHRHEALLNLAFADSGDWWLLCPYDTLSLPADIVGAARRTHPFLVEGGQHRPSPWALDLASISAPFDDPLPDPPPGTPKFVFDFGDVAALRTLVHQVGADAGLGERRTADLVLAADEVVTNTVKHGGGTGSFRIWTECSAVICDIRDAGQLRDALVGRRRPTPDQMGGRGLWIVNQLCDLVQVRSSTAGTTVRLHVERS